MVVSVPPRLPPVWTGRVDSPPTSPVDGDGGGNDWVTVAQAPNDIEAHLLVGRLGEACIETFSMKDRSSSVGWLHGGSDPWGPVLIMVRKLHFEDARIVLAEVAFEAPAAVASVGSMSRPHPGSRWRGPLIWWSLALGLGILLSALSYVGTKETLERCQQEGTCLVPPEGADRDR